MRVLRWVILPLVFVHITLATISGYRAIWQIHRVNIELANTELRPGSRITFGYTSTARVWSDAELKLIQGSIERSLGGDTLPPNVNPSYDPRPKHSRRTIQLTDDALSAFKPGPAVLRLTAYGNMQWLRTPPPVVTERVVTITAGTR